jgi:large subunit ribosomal protein L5e
MKGACDGGLNVPHNDHRFPGFRWEKPEENVGRKKGGGQEEKAKPKACPDPETHLEHILGGHVQAYYDDLKANNPAGFKKQFSKWTKALGGKSFGDLYKAAHAAIRKNPAKAKKAAAAKVTRTVVQAGPVLIQQNSLKKSKNGGKWLRMKKIGKQMRRDRVNAKVQKIMTEL